MSFVKSNVPFFGPRQVPSLALWLDASDATTVSLSSNTQNVTAWRDKSGRNNNATRFGTGFPTYSSNSIVFTGTQAFSTTLPSLMSNQSGFAIVRYSSSNKINILSVNRTSGTAAIQQIIQNNVQSITTYGGSNIVTGATLTQNTMLLYMLVLFQKLLFIILRYQQVKDNKSKAILLGNGVSAQTSHQRTPIK